MKFGDCMFGRHEFCKMTLESGKVCPCDCGEKHGTKFVKGDLDTPIHRLFRKVFEAHVAGTTYSGSESFKIDAESGNFDLAPAVELKYEPAAVLVEVEDTVEQLEEKRK